MYDQSRGLLLGLLKVPPEPAPPAGSPGSVRIFRAGRNFYRVRLIGWTLKQALALAGFLFWLFVLREAEIARAELRSTPRAIEDRASPQDVVGDRTSKGRKPGAIPPRQMLEETSKRAPDWVFPVMWTLKAVTFLVYLGQLPLTYAMLRLDFEQRWYVVTDRSLRLRYGLLTVRELTMSFANLQQVVVSQGPLQRLLGLSDVKVQSAGGGAQPGHRGQGHQSLHTGLFHAVDDAEEVRDLIVERLRLFRETGLGDPDELSRRAGQPTAPDDRPALAAAKGLLAEARALRTAFR